ncbi:hypothetical protein ANCCAN_13664 [Ancylostoma caninum]|uniref:Uncharacterized protein n=1 Tax=Ancylostoma caninum TaxID=29170 RepID=A0A368G9P6_ANCCA|nr:hypothetical protein ANCCAN_13664 [Ancylostoma caninum]
MDLSLSIVISGNIRLILLAVRCIRYYPATKLMAYATTTFNKSEAKSLSIEDLRTAHECVSESSLTTAKDFMKIKLSKEPLAQVQRALVSAEKQDELLPEARPSKSETQMKQIQNLVVRLPDVQAFNQAEEKRKKL